MGWQCILSICDTEQKVMKGFYHHENYSNLKTLFNIVVKRLNFLKNWTLMSVLYNDVQ